MKHISLIGLIGLMGIFAAKPAHAFTMKNDYFIIEMGNFNMSSGKPGNDKYQLSTTVGELAPGLYSGTNYKVKAGFQYIYPFATFGFTISETLIDFGILSPTNPVTRTNTLTITSAVSHGYAIIAFANHPLQAAESNAMIPDTTCDNGACSESTAASWTNTLTYGFGYRCDNVTGTDCAADFSSPTYFKQFADASKGETGKAVMSGITATRTRKGTMTYKVNISGSQTAGVYNNAITFIAVPTF